MCISTAATQHARARYQVALGIVASREPENRAIIAEAMDHPSPDTVRRVLELSRGRVWRNSILEALAEVGVAASEEVLGGRDD